MTNCLIAIEETPLEREVVRPEIVREDKDDELEKIKRITAKPVFLKDESFFTFDRQPVAHLTIKNQGIYGECSILLKYKDKHVTMWSGYLDEGEIRTIHVKIKGLKQVNDFFVGYADNEVVYTTDIFQLDTPWDMMQILAVGGVIGAIITYLVLTKGSKQGGY